MKSVETKTVKHLLPAAAIIFLTLAVSLFLYEKVMNYEEEQCWQELSTTAETVQKEISTKFIDEITKLHLMQEIMLDNGMFSAEDIGQLYLDIVQPTTIFSRIDVLYPDNTLVSNGQVITPGETPGETFDFAFDLDFDEIVRGGERLTRRTTDFLTGDQYIYYLLPVEYDGDMSAVLIAALDTARLTDIFQPLIYNGEANVCIIDSIDGNYIMDSWHKELGNAYQDEGREMLPGYEDVDSKKALKNLETGTAAFKSKTTGSNIYLHFTPMGIFDWQLSIFAEEDVLFANMVHLRRIFLAASITEAVLIALYFYVLFQNTRKLEKSYEYIQKQQEELTRISYTDLLTSLHNRNKFMEDLATLTLNPPSKIGVAYLDLNGLKQINDTQSHEAGDRFLQQAASALKKHFPDSSYRIGGDEFVIICANTEEDGFCEEIAKLRDSLEKANVSSAIGTCWQANVSDINAVLHHAEKRMYKHKESFYLANAPLERPKVYRQR